MERITGALWLRGFLELAGLLFGGIWGYRLDTGGMRFFFALGIPLVMAIAWGVFNVPDDLFCPGYPAGYGHCMGGV